MQTWNDVKRGHDERDRYAVCPPPEVLPHLDAEQLAVLKKWAKPDSERRTHAALFKEAGKLSIERAEALCEKLLTKGWLSRREQLIGGTWQWQSITWLDLEKLQGLLGLSSAQKRQRDRRELLSTSAAWLASRRESVESSALDPDLLDELEQALADLSQHKSLRQEYLAERLSLLQAIAAWHDAGKQGVRQNFALHARGWTKSLKAADWRWLESAFDLERIGIGRFAPIAWLAGDVTLNWGAKSLDVGTAHCLGVPVSDLLQSSGVTGPKRWWLVENRASFEQQARNLKDDVGLIWMPGRPSTAWMEAVSRLLEHLPIPAWISADADPTGIDIACSVGALWTGKGLQWEPYLMGLEQWQATTQYWPLNAHDRRLIGALLGRAELPSSLRALCVAMLEEGRKAEQEAWI